MQRGVKWLLKLQTKKKRKEKLMETFQNYDQQHIMFQKCALQMLRDQEDIIHKQRETIEKKKTSTKKLKTKTYKNNRRTRKKKETTKQTEETKQKFQNPLPTLQRQEI